MIEAGQVNEVRQFFDPSVTDYTKGIRRAIGVPEFDDFLRAEANGGVDERTKQRLLEAAIARLKINNCTLANRQIQKIHRLHGLWKRNMHRLDATEVFLGSRDAWHDHVLAKSLIVLHKFLYGEKKTPHHVVPAGIVSHKDVIAAAAPVAMAATR
uniref:adenylate dimethylallyltransferase (ADP/ATP-dependent) n=3 Tax=Glycine subgen. Soja TaxID=1462606 RepID=K7M0X3_SOYBN